MSTAELLHQRTAEAVDGVAAAEAEVGRHPGAGALKDVTLYDGAVPGQTIHKQS
ncbi:hypothetical protein P7K49_025958 [Saguinus oedipus]|uniref:Uncharacterized protein n=1 Tax=Saguinus oedipus TaxID=9490 RepID=A0ABQ9UJG0_SAGOE|nr:hypothetical protein P7K49_025958 [Saguinus oedipus]